MPKVAACELAFARRLANNLCLRTHFLETLLISFKSRIFIPSKQVSTPPENKRVSDKKPRCYIFFFGSENLSVQVFCRLSIYFVWQFIMKFMLIFIYLLIIIIIIIIIVIIILLFSSRISLTLANNWLTSQCLGDMRQCLAVPREQGEVHDPQQAFCQFPGSCWCHRQWSQRERRNDSRSTISRYQYF